MITRQRVRDHKMLVMVMLLRGLLASSMAQQRGGSCTGHAVKFEGTGNAIASITANVAPVFGNATGITAAWWQRHDGFVHGQSGGAAALILFTPSMTDWFYVQYLDRVNYDGLHHAVAGRFFSSYPAAMGLEEQLSNASSKLDFHDWHHFAFSFEAATGRLRSYVDGQMIDETIRTELIGWDVAGSTSSGLFGVLGVYAYSVESHTPFWSFRGSLDRVHLWAASLTDSEIRAHHAGDSADHRPAALAYEFDEELDAPTAINSGTAGRRFDLVLGRGVTGKRIFKTVSGSYGLYETPRRVASTIPDTRGSSQPAASWPQALTCLHGAPFVQALPRNPLEMVSVDLPVSFSESEKFVVRITTLPSRGRLQRANGSELAVGDEIGREQAAPVGVATSSASVIFTDWEAAGSSITSNGSSDELGLITFGFSGSNGSAIVDGSVHLLPYVPPSADWQMMVCAWPMGVEACARERLELTVAEDAVLPIVLFAGGGAIDSGPRIRISRIPEPWQGTLHQTAFCCDVEARAQSSIVAGEMLVQPRGDLVFLPAKHFSGDLSFEYTAVDSSDFESEAVTMHIHVLHIDDLATLQPHATLELLEDSSIFIPLNASDQEGSLTTVFLSSLPKHGALFLSKAGERGARVSRPHSDYAPRVQLEQFAADVLNVSSYYEWGVGDWHVLQILGERDVFAFGDSPRAFTPRHADGDAFASGHDSAPVTIHGITRAMSYSWDPAAAFAAYGYSEFVELKYEQPVYPVSVTIGENAGMGAVVSIKARLSTWPAFEYVTLWSGEAQPEVRADYASRQQYRTFLPSICQAPTKIDVLRIELDTISVVGWNEIDFVRLVGQLEPSDGVLKMDHAGVVYVPNLNFAGGDGFKVVVSDCAGIQERYSPPETILLSVTQVPDAPIAYGDAVELVLGVEAVVSLRVRDVDSEGRPKCVLSRLPEAAQLFPITDLEISVNASAPGSATASESYFACSFRARSKRCGHDSFSFRAQLGKFLSKEASVSLFTKCLPACHLERDLIYTLSSCNWLTRKHEVLWAWNASGACSPTRSIVLPKSVWVPCVVKFSSRTAHQALKITLTSILFVLNVACIGYVLLRSSLKHFAIDVPCQLRLISLCGVMLVVVGMILTLGEVSQLRCNIRPIWLGYTFMYAPVSAKLYHLWQISKNTSLRHIPLERMKAVVPILLLAAFQFLVAWLISALYPTEVKMHSVGLSRALEYLYPTCDDAKLLDTWLLLIQNAVIILLCLFFAHGTRHADSPSMHLEVRWARAAVLTLLVCYVLVFPLHIIAHREQAFVLADLLIMLCNFVIGVAVCLAVVVPAWFNAKTVPQRALRHRPEQERKSVPAGAMSYFELEKYVDTLLAENSRLAQEIRCQLQAVQLVQAAPPHVAPAQLDTPAVAPPQLDACLPASSTSETHASDARATFNRSTRKSTSRTSGTSCS